MIKVYHASDFLSNCEGAYDPDIKGLVLKAEVDVDYPEEAFLLTYNINDPWTRNFGVSPIGSDFRSTTCGDLLLTESSAYVVAGQDFREVSKDYYAALQAHSIL